MSTSRPVKHARPASTVSRSPKRVKEGEEGNALSETDWERIKREEQRRGKKRDNDEVDDTTEVESASEHGSDEGTIQDHTKKKRANKVKKIEEAKSARNHSDDSPASKWSSKKEKRQRQEELKQAGSSKGKGKRIVDDSEDREIGEEWTDLNGLKWKMGDDGQIRREAVVIEMRLKFPSMPKDSRHPDAKVKIPVHVERFLTEKEYKEAKAKKLLSYQEVERQREVEEAEEQAKSKQRQEEEAKQKRALESGRQITTPKVSLDLHRIGSKAPRLIASLPLPLSLPIAQKVRNLQALFSSARKHSSPSQHALPFTISRTPSLSQHSSLPNTPIPSSVKRLSLSMGRDDAESTVSSSPPAPKEAPKPTTHLSLQKTTPLRPKVSYRLPLASPSSPVSTSINAYSRPSPVADITAKRKREANLLLLLQEEAERRKSRDTIK
jgi:hypothetical protein